MSADRIPKTDSIQELAAFWESHDITEFDDELVEVAEPAFERQVVIQVPLTNRDAAALANIAKSHGVLASELVRQWVCQRVHAP